MGKIKPKKNKLMLSIDDCIEIVNKTIGSGIKYQKRARSNESKEASKRAVDFYATILHYLTQLKMLKNDKAK